MAKSKVYVGLVHYPVYNKNMEVITTSITNLDIHDIARTSRTYDVEKYYIIHPMETQRELIKEIIGYWQEGFGARYNPDRKEAFGRLALAPSIEKAAAEIEQEEGQKPVIVTTDARVYPNTVSYMKIRSYIRDGERPVFLLFGTGWGIERETMLKFDYILEPVYGPSDYNHLSVRSAVAIILDRLLGEAWWKR